MLHLLSVCHLGGVHYPAFAYTTSTYTLALKYLASGRVLLRKKNTWYYSSTNGTLSLRWEHFGLTHNMIIHIQVKFDPVVGLNSLLMACTEHSHKRIQKHTCTPSSNIYCFLCITLLSLLTYRIATYRGITRHKLLSHSWLLVKCLIKLPTSCVPICFIFW